MRLKHGMRIELARIAVEQRTGDAAVALAQHRREGARLRWRQPFDARLPFAVIRLQPFERRLLSRQRDEQRGMRRGARLGEQWQACRGQRADQPSVHVEMREGGTAPRGMHPRRGFRLHHQRAAVPRQPRSGGNSRDPGPDDEKIDLLHCDSVACCNHSA